VASTYDIPVETRESVNSSKYVEWIETASIDVVVSVSAPQIFERELLEAPRWGCINVHTADLPKYRGVLPTFWALYHNENRIGITVHTMNAEVDRGQIIKRSYFSVDDSMTLDDAIKRGKRKGGWTAANAVADISNKSVSLCEMKGEESYYSFPTVDERQEFQRRGRKLL
jgi:methionyl-tRNA formyltransferase